MLFPHLVSFMNKTATKKEAQNEIGLRHEKNRKVCLLIFYIHHESQTTLDGSELPDEMLVKQTRTEKKLLQCFVFCLHM